MSRSSSCFLAVAFGVRNTVGFDFHPTTGDFYFTDNGRDNIGGTDTSITNNSPDCELNFLGSTAGPWPAPRYFGYPYCHTTTASNVPAQAPYLRPTGIGADIVDPETNLGESAVQCNAGRILHTKAVQAFGPHIAPLGMRFGKQPAGAQSNFPAEYSSPDVLYAAHHGSWNRPAGLIGARVMMVKLVPGSGSSSFSKSVKAISRAGPRKTTTKRKLGGVVVPKKSTTKKGVIKTTAKPAPVVAPVSPVISDTPFKIPVMDPSLVVPPKVSQYKSFFSGGVPGDTGLLPDGPNPPVVGSGSLFNGRPVDLEWLPDGSMLISDDQKGRVLRVAYCGTGSFPGGGGGGGGDGDDDDDGEDDRRKFKYARRAATVSKLGMNRCGAVLTHGKTGDSKSSSQSSRSAKLWNNGCAINVDGLGLPSSVKYFKRCMEWDVTGIGNYVTLGFSLLTHPTDSTKVVMDAALVTLDIAGTNGKGWVGFASGKLSGASGSKVDGMVGLQSVIAKASASATSGAQVSDYQLGSNTCSRPQASCFTSTSGYLYSTPSAGIVAGALVQTFGLIVAKTNLKSTSAYIALGDIDATTGAMKQHWKLAKISFNLQAADVGVAGSQSATQINPGLSWAAANSGGSTPAPYPSAPPCTLNGVNYDSCTTLTDAGTSMTFYYTSNNTDPNTLKVGVRAAVDSLGGSSKGWVAWGFNPTSAGSMIGTIAAFARYDASQASKATGAVFKLGSYATGGFTVPSPNPVSGLTAWSDSTGGATYVNMQFTVPWSASSGTPGGFLINYAAGAYNGGSATGADGMAQHAGVPPKACVRNMAGMGPISPCGGCA